MKSFPKYTSDNGSQQLCFSPVKWPINKMTSLKIMCIYLPHGDGDRNWFEMEMQSGGEKERHLSGAFNAQEAFLPLTREKGPGSRTQVLEHCIMCLLPLSATTQSHCKMAFRQRSVCLLVLWILQSLPTNSGIWAHVCANVSESKGFSKQRPSLYFCHKCTLQKGMVLSWIPSEWILILFKGAGGYLYLELSSLPRSQTSKGLPPLQILKHGTQES